ncbi:MAG: putative selenate reductase subunit YgfK, partial [Chloroflexia bacterium]
QEEAGRCLQCSSLCDRCVDVCPNRANVAFTIAPFRRLLPVFRFCDGGILGVATEEVVVAQERQILHLADRCNECGNCATFCVHQGRPYREKPRLFLDEAAFRQETDNAFFFSGNTIRYREHGVEMVLSLEKDGFLFEDQRVRARFSADGSLQEASPVAAFEGEVSLRPALELWVVLRGAHEALPFLAAGKERGPAP